MKNRLFARSALALLGLALLLCGGLITALIAPTQSALARPDEVDQVQLTGQMEAVVLTGQDLGGLAGRPVADLALYTYSRAGWAPIPFQIDERSITGSLAVDDDGLLDGNDELVFMAQDGGSQAPAWSWPEDGSSQQQPRLAIRVTDPVNANALMGWVYLYNSASLPRSQVTYMHWDEGQQIVATRSYTGVFDPTHFVGLADLFIHGSPDILDRQKLRLAASLGGFPINRNEEDLLGTIPSTVTLDVLGPVRGVKDGELLAITFYPDRFNIVTSFEVPNVSPASVKSVRISLDFNDPATTGITHYTDSNGSSAVIDGQQDGVATAQPVEWFQVNGGATGPGGMVMFLQNPQATGGTVAGYYMDNGNFDSEDRGDGRSFADTGLLFQDPTGQIHASLVGYILPPGTEQPMGDTYAQRLSMPLTATVQSETIYTGTIHTAYLPAVKR